MYSADFSLDPYARARANRQASTSGRPSEESSMDTVSRSRSNTVASRPLRRIAPLIGLVLILSCAAAGAAQQTFATPEAGVDALMQAVRANDEPALRTLFGADAGRLIDSGDKVADAENRARFTKAYTDAHRLDRVDDSHVTLIVGKDEWPMPIPLVAERGRWHFDTRSGEDEILARRIGRNELSAMKVCLAVVDAERDYAAHDLDKDGVPEYAAHFVSRPGKHDGLYWPTSTNEQPSPLGTLLAAAADEGYAAPGARSLEPYHGYYYRILTRQGKGAPGGARDYRVRGKLIAGFALLAYPAGYGKSGVMTFLVGSDGVVYEKNLGKDTAKAVLAIASFDPDASWKKADLTK
jgi:hypothetical protein